MNLGTCAGKTERIVRLVIGAGMVVFGFLDVSSDVWVRGMYVVIGVVIAAGGT